MNAAAIEAMYRKHGPAVLRRARAILQDEQAARDVMQEVFVQAIREGDGFRGEASPTTWIYRITTNLCLNRIRDEKRRAELLSLHLPRAEEAREPNAEQRVTLAAILRRVPEELREIAVYYYVDQMSHDEIAAVVRTSRRTVGNRLEEFRRAARAAAAAEVEQRAEVVS